MTQTIGTIVDLRRYPVRSMRGEILPSFALDNEGPRGDRAYGVYEIATAEEGQASRVKKWRDLIRFQARYLVEPTADGPAAPVEITFPDGRRMAGDCAELGPALGIALGRAVCLRAPQDEASPPGRAYELAPLHLITTATIRQFQENHPASRFDPARYRPNIVLDTPGQTGFIESAWIGRELAIGEKIRLGISAHCVRCALLTLDQGDLPQDPWVFRAAVGENEGHAGIYAQVLSGGTLRAGDPVRLI